MCKVETDLKCIHSNFCIKLIFFHNFYVKKVNLLFLSYKYFLFSTLYLRCSIKIHSKKSVFYFSTKENTIIL